MFIHIVCLVSGTVYEGSFVEGMMQGYGVMKDKTAGLWEGQWHRGMQHGQGKCTFDDHSFVGEFSNGKVEGQGVLTVFKGTYSACMYVRYTRFDVGSLLLCTHEFVLLSSFLFNTKNNTL